MATFTVPGATLYYEVQGSGPPFLLIHGGGGDIVPFGPMAALLADRHTVISFVRRGFARSPLDGPVVDDLRLAADADDAHRLLAHLSDEPAHVFGSSSGAIVALDLAARHPEQVRTLISHEPPSVTLLPDGDDLLAALDGIYDTYRQSGPDTAMAEFGRLVGMPAGPRPAEGQELPPMVVEMMDRMRGNLLFWLEHELRVYPRATPDLAALRRLGDRLVPAGGRESKDQFPYRPNLAMAERLGLGVVDFPGDHVGYARHPEEFVKQLIPVLR